MSKPFLVTTREPDLAELAYCETCECYCSLESATTSHAECVITWLIQEVA